jgi:hypothetical protein
MKDLVQPAADLGGTQCDHPVSDDDHWFTCVFKYNGRQGPNAFLIDTPFGKPYVTALGDLSQKLADAEEEIECLTAMASGEN